MSTVLCHILDRSLPFSQNLSPVSIPLPCSTLALCSILVLPLPSSSSDPPLLFIPLSLSLSFGLLRHRLAVSVRMWRVHARAYFDIANLGRQCLRNDEADQQVCRGILMIPPSLTWQRHLRMELFCFLCCVKGSLLESLKSGQEKGVGTSQSRHDQRCLFCERVLKQTRCRHRNAYLNDSPATRK